MLRLGIPAYVFADLMLSTMAGGFLQPWTPGPTKDYSKNTDFVIGMHIITEWSANFSNATINLNQDSQPGDARRGLSMALEVSYNQTTWGWTVSYGGLDSSYNNVFYFSVETSNGEDSFTSHYSNISNALTTTKSSAGAALSTMTSTSLSTVAFTTPTSSVSTTSQSTAPATVTVMPSSNGGTPVGTIAGIVVGVVFGALILAGGAWWAWRFTKRRNAASKTQLPTLDSNQPYYDGEQKPPEANTDQIFELHDPVERPVDGLHESGGRPIHELHNSIGEPGR